MSYAPTADSFHVPNVRQRPKRSWLSRLFFREVPAPAPAPPKRRDSAYDELQDLPEFMLVGREPGKADVSEIPGRDYPPVPKLEDYWPKREPKPEPKQEPVAEPLPPPKLDNLTELKHRLRSCTYGEFIEALSAITGEEQKPHGEIADSAWKWAIAA